MNCKDDIDIKVQAVLYSLQSDHSLQLIQHDCSVVYIDYQSTSTVCFSS